RDGRSVSTIDRRAKWQAQTPQMFRLGTLREALTRATEVTDEASAIEALGLEPKLVPCGMENFKITWPQDFELAERLLRTRDAAPGRPKQGPTLSEGRAPYSANGESTSS
ncbi:MAG: 2-C-methyl-D-erythritol 4-phosphate cytidylyltransferase, partial [Rhizobacter sp.]